MATSDIITDRVCSTRREVMFSVCPQLGGTPARSRQGGTPSNLEWGGTLARSRWGGGPHPALDRGYPIRFDTGCTLARSRWGGTPEYPLPGMGYPLPPPGTGQQMEYLIRRGRYASCVQAGLSCWNLSCNLSEIHLLWKAFFLRPLCFCIVSSRT